MAKMSAELRRELADIVGDTHDEIPEGAFTARDVAAQMGLTTEGAVYRLNKLVSAGRWSKAKYKVTLYYWPVNK